MSAHTAMLFQRRAAIAAANARDLLDAGHTYEAIICQNAARHAAREARFWMGMDRFPEEDRCAPARSSK